MLKLSDLAQRPDFQRGPLSISPSRRRVEGPAGTVHLEPLVMQVFLLLIDARGELVTRDQLFAEVWGGAMVGDDSLNRAIARVRRVAGETSPGSFEIETIPRTGYRLTGDIAGALPTDPAASPEQPRVSRRVLVGGGVAAAAVVGAGGLWWTDHQEDRRFDELMARGEEALAYGEPTANPAQYFKQAMALRPDNARAVGLFAHARAVRATSADDPGSALQEAHRAARAALRLDPSEPYARLAMNIIQRPTQDFASSEDQFRQILASHPENTSAMRGLWNMLQCVGRSRDALALVEKAIAVQPLGAANHFPRAQLLWILGRNAEADRVIDDAMQIWPEHRFVRFARFTIFAFTGRPQAALAMLESRSTAPQQYSAEQIALWRVSLVALDERTPAAIEVARQANLEAAKRDLDFSSQAIIALSGLGETDAAFEVANALFVVPGTPHARKPATSTAWRFAPWLFTPPTASMRRDPRFDAICDGIGLTQYWAKRGIKPDYQLGIT